MSLDHLTPIGAAVRRCIDRLRVAPVTPSTIYADGSKRWVGGGWGVYVSAPLDGRRTIVLTGPRVDVARYRSGGSFARIGGRRIV